MAAVTFPVAPDGDAGSDDVPQSNRATWKARLGRVADVLEAGNETARLARERRDQVIVQACEAGESTRDVARWARISQPRVQAILNEH